jgi:hypothetical protein
MNLGAIGGKYQILANMGFTERTLKKLTLGYDQRAAYRSQSTSINATQTSVADQETTIDLTKGYVYQEVFTADGVTKTYQVTKNNAILPSTVSDVMVMRNGLFLNEVYIDNIDGSNGTLELTFLPDNGDEIVIIWFMALPTSYKLFQEQFTADGTQTAFTVTKNDGQISSSTDAIILMRNGQHINNDYISGINTLTGTLTMTFAPDNGDEITIIWFY